MLSGASTPLTARMGVAGAVETVNVSAVTPAVDLKRETTTTHVMAAELQDLPNSRDPWAVLQTVPTVYMDRVNVGGSESGQQSNYNAKGAQATDNSWNIDGVPVTDMGDSVVRPEVGRLLGVLLRCGQRATRWPSPPAAPTCRIPRRACSSTWC